MLKGWLDRVFRQGVAYQFGPGGVEGLLAGRPAVVFTTSTCSGSYRSFRTSDSSADWTFRNVYFPGIVISRSIFEPVDGPPRSARRPESMASDIVVSFSGMSSTASPR